MIYFAWTVEDNVLVWHFLNESEYYILLKALKALKVKMVATNSSRASEHEVRLKTWSDFVLLKDYPDTFHILKKIK